MKYFILFFALLTLGTSFSQGQGDLVIYSNTGDQFYVILNGVRQNDRPETNVKVTGLTNNWYSCKVLSANNNFELEKNVVVKYDTLVTYRIINKKKKKYKLRFFTQTPLGTATAESNQAVVAYHATENAMDNSTTQNNNTNTTNNNTANTNVNGTTSTTTTTTTTTNSSATNANNGNAQANSSVNTNANGNGESVNVSINVSENGMGADVNVNASGTGTNGQNENVNTSTSVNSSSSSTTTTSSSTNGNTSHEETTVNSGTTNNGTYYEETTTTTTTTTSTSGNANNNTLYQDEDMTVSMDNNTSCSTSDAEVDKLVKQVKDEAFEDDQQRVANMAAKNKCMNVDQIKRVAEAFSFADNKLSFMKTAYDNCPDKDNYYQLMEVLTFSSDKEELEKFINSK